MKVFLVKTDLRNGDSMENKDQPMTFYEKMQMNREETFVYAVDDTSSMGTRGYDYSTVTVIPATTIYMRTTEDDTKNYLP